MGLILHEILASPPARAVKLCLHELGLQAEYKNCDLLNKAQLSEEYIKKNPQHTVPTLEDGDFIIWDSHAINAYLVSTYAKTDALYPKDPKVRALIDQRLHFDSGVLFPALRNIAFKIIYLGAKSVPDEDRQRGRAALDFVEKFLEGRQFITGDTFNIADFSVYTTASALLEFLQVSEHYPNINNYCNSCRATFKGSKQDDEGLKSLVTLLQRKLSEK